MMMMLACLVALLAFAGTQTAYGQGATQEANLGGDVLVLDVNSLTYSGGPNHGGTGVRSAEACAAACQANDKCNTWVFCAGKDQYGCGSGCSPGANEYDPTKSSDTTRFGMFTRCSCVGSNDPSRTDCNWPANMCSLKFNSGTPPVYGTGNNWVSGLIARPK